MEVSPLQPVPPNAEERAVAARLAAAVRRLERRAGRSPMYVADTVNHDAGYYYYRFRDGVYRYEARERGRLCLHRTTSSADQLVWWLVKDLARDVTSATHPPAPARHWWRRPSPLGYAEREAAFLAHALAGDPAAALGGSEETVVARRLADVVTRLERVSGRRPVWVPTTEDQDLGYPFYRVIDGRYTYAARERGTLVFERTTRSQDQLVDWIAQDLVGDVARHHELEHRVEGQDSRRLYFQLWEDWSRAIDPVWGDQVAAEIAGILEVAPLNDGPHR